MTNKVPSLVSRLLLELKKHGHLTETAHALGVSQPAASKALQRFESVLGVALIRRNVRPLQLTDEGEIVAEFAQKQLDLEIALERRIQGIKKSGASTVRFASFGPSASTHLLPRIVEKLKVYLPDLEVSIQELNDAEAIAALSDGLVDFATVIQGEDEDVEYIALDNDQLIALVPVTSLLAKHTALCAKQLSNEHFIMSKGGSESLIRTWFSRSGYEPKVQHCALQLTSILGMIRGGMGVSIVAKMAMPHSHPDVVAVPLTPEQPRIICIARHNKDFNSHTAKQVWELLKRFNN